MAAAMYREGLEAYRTGSYETAVLQFTTALETGSKEAARIHDARSAAYEKLGRIRSALEDARAVVTLLPNSYKGYLRGGRLCRLAEKWERGEAMLEKAAKQSDVNEKVLLEIQSELDTLRKLKIKSTFSPISILPLDLFVQIISLATKPPPQHVDSPSHLFSQTLLRASHVCQSWYAAIADAPQLWDTLRLDAPLKDEKLIELTRFWSLRSKGREGMGLGFKGIRAPGGLSAKVCQEVASIIQRDGSGSQLESFDQIMAPRPMLDPSPAFVRKLLVPTTRHVSLAIQAMWSASDGFEWIDVLARRPEVRDFSLTYGSGMHGMYGRGLRDGIPQGESMVEHLALCRVPNRLAHAFDFPRLKSFKYISADEGRDSEVPLIPLLNGIPLRNLEELSLVGCDSFDHSPLDAVAFDSLISLTLRKSSRLASVLLDSLAGSLPFPSLKHLDLSRMRLDPTHLRLFSSDSAPHLTSLDLSFTTFTTKFEPSHFPIFAALETLNLSRTAWPTNQLVEELRTTTPVIKSLNLSGCGSGERALTGSAIVNLVRARRLIPSPPTPPSPSSWICTTNSLYSPTPSADASSIPSTKFETAMQELDLQNLMGIETVAVDWLKANMRKGTVKFKFL